MCGFCVVSLVAILATCVLPFVLCGLWWLHSQSNFLAEHGRRWFPKKEEVLADAITIDGREEWRCKFCSETYVWMLWSCRRCYSNIQAGLQGKQKQAISAKTKGWSSGSPSSSGREERNLEIRKRRSRSCVHKWSFSVSSKDGAKGRRRKESLREEEVVLKKTARWRLRKKRA